MTRRLAVSLLTAAVLALAFVAGPARAGSAGGSLTVTATVLGSCTINSPTLAFGDYDPADVLPTDAFADITVTCNEGAAYEIVLAGTNDDRAMTGAGGTLEFDLFSDAGRTALWDASNPVTGTATLVGFDDYTHTVYGRIPAGIPAATGAYTGNIAMTVNF